MIRYNAWTCRHEPLHAKSERFVGTYLGRILMASTQVSLMRRIDAAMETFA